MKLYKMILLYSKYLQLSILIINYSEINLKYYFVLLIFNYFYTFNLINNLSIISNIFILIYIILNKSNIYDPFVFKLIFYI